MKKRKPANAKGGASLLPLGLGKDSNSELLNVLKFVALFALAFFPLQYALSSTPTLSAPAAGSAKLLLDLSGRPAGLDLSGPTPVLSVSEISNPVEIIPLCSGATELAAVIALVFASVDRTPKRRIAGAIAGSLAILAFNPARIFLTLSLYDSANPVASVFAHDVLFRFSLVAFIAVFYAIWYYWDLPRRKEK